MGAAAGERPHYKVFGGAFGQGSDSFPCRGCCEFYFKVTGRKARYLAASAEEQPTEAAAPEPAAEADTVEEEETPLISVAAKEAAEKAHAAALELVNSQLVVPPVMRSGRGRPSKDAPTFSSIAWMAAHRALAYVPLFDDGISSSNGLTTCKWLTPEQRQDAQNRAGTRTHTKLMAK